MTDSMQRRDRRVRAPRTRTKQQAYNDGARHHARARPRALDGPLAGGGGGEEADAAARSSRSDVESRTTCASASTPKRKAMLAAAEALEFEKAARLREMQGCATSCATPSASAARTRPRRCGTADGRLAAAREPSRREDKPSATAGTLLGGGRPAAVDGTRRVPLPTSDGGRRLRGQGAQPADRVRSYFGRSPHDGTPARRALRRTATCTTSTFISTETEHEAFLLENQLVKRHKPAYNVKLRDDKDFLYVRVDRRHGRSPYLGLARRPKRSHDEGPEPTTGPFASAKSPCVAPCACSAACMPAARLHATGSSPARTRPCLKYEMKRCCGPVRRRPRQPKEDYASAADRGLDRRDRGALRADTIARARAAP